MSEGTKWFLVSYVPLLQPDFRIFNTEEAVRKFLPVFSKGVTRHGQAEACLWARKSDGAIMPVFALERAKEIVDHLKMWSEEKPSDWFKLYVYQTKKKYAVILFPDIQRSIGRFKFRLALGDPGQPFVDEKKDTIEIVCHPLLFTSLDLGMIKKVQLTSPVTLGIIEWKGLNTKDLTANPEPFEIGPFELGDNTNMKRYFDSLLE